MRKDITKKFLGKENRYVGTILSKGVVSFIYRKKINIDANQISYDVIEFGNVFSTSELTKLNKNNFLALKNIVEKKGKRVEFNMICCEGDKSHSDFLLGETEVTQELYELVMGYNPSYFEGKNSKQRPVERLTWYDAIMFCNKLSLLTNKRPYYEIKGIKYEDQTQTNIKEASVETNEKANGFRLPLEKEWEYAARASTNNQYVGTNDKSKLKEYAWFDKNSRKHTHSVKQKKPNEWGLYDMSGNVLEWCYDLYDNNSNDRVIRGGGWQNFHMSLRSTFRSKYSPGDRGNAIGFRVAASLVN